MGGIHGYQYMKLRPQLKVQEMFRSSNRLVILGSKSFVLNHESISWFDSKTDPGNSIGILTILTPWDPKVYYVNRHLHNIIVEQNDFRKINPKKKKKNTQRISANNFRCPLFRFSELLRWSPRILWRMMKQLMLHWKEQKTTILLDKWRKIDNAESRTDARVKKRENFNAHSMLSCTTKYLKSYDTLENHINDSHHPWLRRLYTPNIQKMQPKKTVV